MTHIIQFENVGLRYGNASETLSDLNFSLRRGGFYFLTGPSGAGKTSLLKLLYLAQRPSRGVVRLFGDDMVTMAREKLPAYRQRIGVVFQDFRLIPHLSIFENVALPLRVAGEDAAAIGQPVTEILTWVGLGARTDALPQTLSGGEQQRVAIARLFQRRLGLDALFGASLGFFAGSLAILLLGYRFTAMGSELLGSLGLGVLGWLALLALPLATALLAMLAARLTVLAALRHML
ncbi:MAG: cell division ATP-binding protein FtsE [Chakrabartia sp.]